MTTAAETAAVAATTTQTAAAAMATATASDEGDGNGQGDGGGCFVLINLPLRRQPKLEFLMTYVMVKYDT